MEKIQRSTRFHPTKHAIDRMRERIHPGISEKRAAELLRSLAKTARPLKRTYGGEA